MAIDNYMSDKNNKKPSTQPSTYNFRARAARYLPSVVIIWGAIIFYRNDSYYSGFLTQSTQKTLLLFAFSYSLVGLFVYLIAPIERIPKSKGYIAFKFFKRIVLNLRSCRIRFISGIKQERLKVTQEERTAVLFILVKLFFLPLMLNFLFGNYESVKSSLDSPSFNNLLFSVDGFNTFIFPLLFSVILLVDTVIFTFGYMFDADFLKNKVKSVDPTYFGWLVCLASYPPFNGIVTNYTSWYANNNAYFGSSSTTFFMRLIIIILMSVYVSATIALGSKASNLTNRGIVSRGPYKFIRHPAYVSKSLAWWIMIIPVFSIAAFLSMLVWSTIYYLRAITEERHLFNDPVYREYCRNVRSRFIPWLNKPLPPDIAKT